jgi:hypothetical protein
VMNCLKMLFDTLCTVPSNITPPQVTGDPVGDTASTVPLQVTTEPVGDTVSTVPSNTLPQVTGDPVRDTASTVPSNTPPKVTADSVSATVSKVPSKKVVVPIPWDEFPHPVVKGNPKRVGDESLYRHVCKLLGKDVTNGNESSSAEGSSKVWQWPGTEARPRYRRDPPPDVLINFFQDSEVDPSSS